jgi:hypothetical protein
MTRLLLALLVSFVALQGNATALAFPKSPISTHYGRPVVETRVTYYLWTGHRMANGEWPHFGAAACSLWVPFGTRITLADGRTVTCKDRGRIDSELWIDIYVDSAEQGRREVAQRYGRRTAILAWESP